MSKEILDDTLIDPAARADLRSTCICKIALTAQSCSSSAVQADQAFVELAGSEIHTFEPPLFTLLADALHKWLVWQNSSLE